MFDLKMHAFLGLFLPRDKIATGSFDKTCKLWCAETGKCFHTFRGHTAEIVCINRNDSITVSVCSFSN